MPLIRNAVSTTCGAIRTIRLCKFAEWLNIQTPRRTNPAMLKMAKLTWMIFSAEYMDVQIYYFRAGVGARPDRRSLILTTDFDRGKPVLRRGTYLWFYSPFLAKIWREKSTILQVRLPDAFSPTFRSDSCCVTHFERSLLVLLGRRRVRGRHVLINI